MPDCACSVPGAFLRFGDTDTVVECACLDT